MARNRGSGGRNHPSNKTMVRVAKERQGALFDHLDSRVSEFTAATERSDAVARMINDGDYDFLAFAGDPQYDYPGEPDRERPHTFHAMVGTLSTVLSPHHFRPPDEGRSLPPGAPIPETYEAVWSALQAHAQFDPDRQEAAMQQALPTSLGDVDALGTNGFSRRVSTPLHWTMRQGSAEDVRQGSSFVPVALPLRLDQSESGLRLGSPSRRFPSASESYVLRHAMHQRRLHARELGGLAPVDSLTTTGLQIDPRSGLITTGGRGLTIVRKSMIHNLADSLFLQQESNDGLSSDVFFRPIRRRKRKLPSGQIVQRPVLIEGAGDKPREVNVNAVYDLLREHRDTRRKVIDALGHSAGVPEAPDPDTVGSADSVISQGMPHIHDLMVQLRHLRGHLSVLGTQEQFGPMFSPKLGNNPDAPDPMSSDPMSLNAFPPRQKAPSSAGLANIAQGIGRQEINRPEDSASPEDMAAAAAGHVRTPNEPSIHDLFKETNNLSYIDSPRHHLPNWEWADHPYLRANNGKSLIDTPIVYDNDTLLRTDTYKIPDRTGQRTIPRPQSEEQSAVGEQTHTRAAQIHNAWLTKPENQERVRREGMTALDVTRAALEAHVRKLAKRDFQRGEPIPMPDGLPSGDSESHLHRLGFAPDEIAKIQRQRSLNDAKKSVDESVNASFPVDPSKYSEPHHRPRTSKHVSRLVTHLNNFFSAVGEGNPVSVSTKVVQVSPTRRQKRFVVHITNVEQRDALGVAKQTRAARLLADHYEMVSHHEGRPSRPFLRDPNRQLKAAVNRRGIEQEEEFDPPEQEKKVAPPEKKKVAPPKKTVPVESDTQKRIVRKTQAGSLEHADRVLRRLQRKLASEGKRGHFTQLAGATDEFKVMPHPDARNGHLIVTGTLPAEAHARLDAEGYFDEAKKHYDVIDRDTFHEKYADAYAHPEARKGV